MCWWLCNRRGGVTLHRLGVGHGERGGVYCGTCCGACCVWRLLCVAPAVQQASNRVHSQHAVTTCLLGPRACSSNVASAGSTCCAINRRTACSTRAPWGLGAPSPDGRKGGSPGRAAAPLLLLLLLPLLPPLPLLLLPETRLITAHAASASAASTASLLMACAAADDALP